MVKAFWCKVSHRAWGCSGSGIKSYLFLPQVARGEICEDSADKHHIWDLHLSDHWQSRGATTIFSHPLQTDPLREDLELLAFNTECMYTILHIFNSLWSWAAFFSPRRLQDLTHHFREHLLFLLHGQKSYAPTGVLLCYLLYIKTGFKNERGKGWHCLWKPHSEQPVIGEGSVHYWVGHKTWKNFLQ